MTRHAPGAEQQRAAVLRFARLGRPIYCGGRRRRLVALTFDDGPGPYTTLAFKALRRAHAQATFFLVGRSIARYPGLPKRERAFGAIGDHTMTHQFLPALTPASADAEIVGGRAAALRNAGGPADLFRPPYEGRTPAIDAEVRSQGMATILWNVDSGDSRTTAPEDFKVIAATVDRSVRAGSIVLMHENRGQTIRALPTIFATLRRRGLRPVTVPDLLAQDPPTTSQLDAGGRGCFSRSRG